MVGNRIAADLSECVGDQGAGFDAGRAFHAGVEIESRCPRGGGCAGVGRRKTAGKKDAFGTGETCGKCCAERFAGSAGESADCGVKKRSIDESVVKQPVDEPDAAFGFSLAEGIHAEGGDETFIVDEHILQEFEDRDILHNSDQKYLPMEGPQIIKVDKVEELPVFPGGMKSLADWMEKNIPYPANLIKAKVQGDMEVSFIVGVDGRVSDVRLTKKLHPQLDKLVLAAFKRMPPWKPGKTDGVPVIVIMTYPLHFTAR